MFQWITFTLIITFLITSKITYLETKLLFPLVTEISNSKNSFLGVSSTIRSKRFADALELPLCIVHFGKLHPGNSCSQCIHFVGKTREEVATSEDMKIVGDVKEKVTILVTDLADTLAMECVMAESLIANGAKQVYTLME